MRLAGGLRWRLAARGLLVGPIGPFRLDFRFAAFAVLQFNGNG